MDDKEIQQLLKESKMLILHQHQKKSEIKQLIQNQKHYFLLSIICNLNDDKVNIVSDELRNFNRLTCLKIVFNKNQLKSLESISILGQSLVFLNQLIYLFIDIGNQQNIKNMQKDISSFGLNLAALQNLKVFSFKIYQASIIGQKGAKAIRNGLENLKNITNISLHLTFNSDMEDYFLIWEQFYECLIKLQSLKVLDLSLYFNTNFQLPKKSNKIQTDLKNLINIKCLKIKLVESVDIQYWGFSLLQDAVFSLKNLKEVNIYAKTTYLKGEDLFHYLDQLLSMQNLEKLEVQYECEENKEIIHELGANLKVQSNLMNFKFDIYKSCSSRYMSEISFHKNIVFLSNLITFDISIVGFNIHYESFEQLENLFSHCSKLKQLNITTSGIPQEIEKVENMLNCFQKIDNLLELKLSLDYCVQTEENYSIEHQSVIFQRLQHLQNLQKLHLEFGYNYYGNIKLQNLTECFFNLKNLKYLFISELYSQEFQSDFVQILGDSIQHLEQLETLKIQLFTLINNFETLSNSFKELEKLTDLAIIYVGDDLSNISEEEFLHFLQGIKHLKNLIQFQTNIIRPEYYNFKKFVNALSTLKQLRQINIELDGRQDQIKNTYIQKKIFKLVQLYDYVDF